MVKPASQEGSIKFEIARRQTLHRDGQFISEGEVEQVIVIPGRG